jgi:hypothetical protein
LGSRTLTSELEFFATSSSEAAKRKAQRKLLQIIVRQLITLRPGGAPTLRTWNALVQFTA